jgi:hypothetical protein
MRASTLEEEGIDRSEKYLVNLIYKKDSVLGQIWGSTECVCETARCFLLEKLGR